MSKPRIAAVILAAGKGTRLKTALPKVLHEICGRPMLAYVLEACRAAGVTDCLVVVGHEKQMVMQTFADDDAITWVAQDEQLGTGHAVMCCREQLADRYDRVLILCGDGPLIRPETIRTLLATHAEQAAAATLATSTIPDPTGYGRIVRDAAGRLQGIVEHRDCTPDQLAIGEVNPSYYCYETADLLAALDRIDNHNAKREYYLTDTLGLLINAGKTVAAIAAVPPEDIFSINSRADLALVSRVMRDRVNARWMNDGVTIIDPQTTWIDTRATIGPDTTIHPFTVVSGAARIGSGCKLGPFVELPAGAVIADGATVAGCARAAT